jgi:hypothetical protein
MARSSTSYPSKWRSGKTTVIRVPERLAGDLLKIARQMDAQPSGRLREDEGVWDWKTHRPAKVRYTARQPVNVASVPQRSPFRYPVCSW